MPKNGMSANMIQILQKKINVKYGLSINIYLTFPYLSYFKQVHIVYYSLYLQFLIISDKKLDIFKTVRTFSFGFYYEIESMVNISEVKFGEPTENSG